MERKTSSAVGAWIAIGIGIGVALGALTHNPSMWIGLAVVALVLANKRWRR